MVNAKLNLPLRRAIRAVLFSGVVLGMNAISSRAEQPFRPANTAPESWKSFAARLTAAFEVKLKGGEIATRFQEKLEQMRASAADRPPPSVVVAAYIGGDGSVTRIDFPTLGAVEADNDLRLLLSSATSSPPPPDMPQPLRLRLSLLPKK